MPDGNHARIDRFVSLGVVASAIVVSLGDLTGLQSLQLENAPRRASQTMQMAVCGRPILAPQRHRPP
jgi:hypothetical protein